MNHKPLILLVGKSGSGKTTIAEYLEKHYGMKMLESYTTREPRYEGEKGHTFITYNEYLQLQNKVGVTYFDGKYYCCTQEQCDNSDVYVIDPDGIAVFRRNYKGNRNHIIIYLKVNPFVRLFRMVLSASSSRLKITVGLLYPFEIFTRICSSPETMSTIFSTTSKRQEKYWKSIPSSSVATKISLPRNSHAVIMFRLRNHLNPIATAHDWSWKGTCLGT